VEQSTVGAEYEWLRAHDRNEAMIAEAGLRKYVLARFGKDDGGGEEGDRCRRVIWDVAGDGGAWRGSDRGMAR
jgi:hypothetical protein